VTAEEATRPDEGVRNAARPRWRVSPFVLSACVVFLAVALVYGAPTPHVNEYFYVVGLEVWHDPSFLANDFTFEPTGQVLVFNVLVSPLLGVMSLEALAWIGRLTCWAALTVLVLRLAGRMGARPWPAAIALVLWIGYQQRVPGADWIFGTFEAKPIAYIFLFASLLLILRGSIPAALACAGATFSFHTGVGVWSVLPLLGAMLLTPKLRRPTLRWWWLTAVIAAPGIVGLLFELGETSGSRSIWRFVTESVLPFHFDPFYFGVPGLVLVFVMFAVNVVYAFRGPARSDTLRFLACWQCLLAVPTVGGLMAYALGRYELLKYFPFRVFPIMASLLFAFTLASAWESRRELWAARGQPVARAMLCTMLVGLIGVLIVANPIKEEAFALRRNYREWRATPTSAERALRWVSDHTPSDAVVIAPPIGPQVFYLAERALVGSPDVIRFEGVDEWGERVADQLGPGFVRSPRGGLSERDHLALYDRMTTSDIERLVRRYGARYLVSREDYPYEVLHREGRYRVYALPAAT
jgi:hypothetical protein